MATTENMSLLKVCLIRALELATPDGAKPGMWDVLTCSARAAKVADFICTWAVAQEELGDDDLILEAYIMGGYDSRTTTMRRIRDFREMFPDEHVPNRIALMVREAARRDRAKRPTSALRVAV
jgi:hypothetical protein